MYKKIIYAEAYCLLIFFAIGLSHAKEFLDLNEVKLTFTGNTVEGRVIKRDTSYKMYFHPSGKLIRLDSKDKLERGIWNIKSNETLCLTFVSEECYKVSKRGEDQFDLLNKNGDLELSIVKVILGNPDKLKP